ncbi:ComF family protein [Clostridium algidicarnis]|uniref:ComF family protein n=1 Tax=Clostridium algidicarnis TaxID=37659 RepID=UPI001C0BCEDB|nr:phosphoribosyltransferase family protein [Clostridium algidicarnis]MBU3195076.1 ComF family protein [Clostridium algidicarnis]
MGKRFNKYLNKENLKIYKTNGNSLKRFMKDKTKVLVTSLRYLINCSLSIVFPEGSFCLLCKEERLQECFLCYECKNKIKLNKEAFYIEIKDMELVYYSTSYYSHEIRELLMKFKYKRDFNVARFFVSNIMQIIDYNKINFDIICYVPASKDGKNARGYDQSEILACIIKEQSGKKVVRCIKRNTNTKEQKTVSVENRWENLRTAFKFDIKYLKEVKDKKIILIDDVVTTGSTLYFCYKELKNNGAKEINILTVAKSRL